jgi:hypothetical protein
LECQHYFVPRLFSISTIYFEPAVHQALKIRAATSNLPIFEIVDEAVCILMLEDQEDLEAFTTKKNEPELNYEERLSDLKNMAKYKLALKISVKKIFV